MADDPAEFIALVREVFREIKKFTIFIRNQRNTSAALVVLTFFLALFTSTQSVFTGLQIKPLRDSAAAAKSAAETAAREVEVSERPWIVIDNVRVPSNQTLIVGKSIVITTIGMDVKNIGHSPATNVTAHLILRLSGGPEGDIVKGICEGAIPPADGFGDIIFPDKIGPPASYPINLSKEDVGKFWDAPPTNRILAVAGCVDYRSPISREYYYTGFLYDIFVLPSYPTDTARIQPSNIVLQNSSLGFVVK